MWRLSPTPSSFLAVLALLVACASEPLPVPPAPVGARPPLSAPDYLRHVAYQVPVDERVLLRWPEAAMPLRVHLEAPPAGWVTDPSAAREAVRLGVLGWSDVVAPGVPSFVFVDRARDADIPIVWSRVTRGAFIASCRYEIDVTRRRLDVRELMVTGRWRDGSEVALPQLEAAILHEMGHALGLTGHSPNPRDLMYKYVTHETRPVLSQRDRNTLRALYSRPNGTRVLGASAIR